MDNGLLISLILVLSSAVAFVIGIITLLITHRIKSQGISAQAKVVAFKQMKDTVAPVLEYETENGTITSTSSFSMTRSLYSFKVGDVINIYYDREKNTRFRIEGMKIYTVMSFIPIIIGAICLIMAIVLPMLIE